MHRVATLPLRIVVLTLAAMSVSVNAGADAGKSPAAKENKPMIALVTGSTSGLGREVALRLAARGTQVIVHGRDSERGEALVKEIEKQGGKARFYRADFARLADVRELAKAVQRDYDRLDLLVNNAGIAGAPRQLSADGYELHFQVNYLSHFLLTDLLLPLLKKSAPARIVNVASGAQTPIDFNAVSQPLLRIPDAHAFQINWTLVNCGVTKVIYSERGKYLLTLNEHAHFEGERRD
jgi:hypothetical protein